MVSIDLHAVFLMFTFLCCYVKLRLPVDCVSTLYTVTGEYVHSSVQNSQSCSEYRVIIQGQLDQYPSERGEKARDGCW